MKVICAFAALVAGGNAFVFPGAKLLGAHRLASPLGAEAEEAEPMNLRNIAIIAHVDHGKTTLVDAMLKQTDVFRANEVMGERVMDNNDQERERGITILAKNAAINYKGTKINIVDTPGHADFGGEVERIMNMVDGVLLVVDSVDGPKPQTRFVLKKALERGIKPMLVVNKIDRPTARPEYVVDKVFDLFCELGATDEQTDFDICYASAIKGMSGASPETVVDGLTTLFDKICELPPPPAGSPAASKQLLIANIDYDDFKGKMGIGRLTAGTLKVGSTVGYTKPGKPVKTGKIAELFVFDNLGRTAVDEVSAGEICMITGLDGIAIGDTIVDKDDPQPMTPIAIEEPTVRMSFMVNKSPFAGKDPKSTRLTSRMIRDRLYKELDRNVALRVEDDPDSADTYIVSGRGQLHLTVLIETMRREGFELMIGSPQVIFKQDPDTKKKLEPFEEIECTVPEEYVGAVVDLLAKRKGTMLDLVASAGTEKTTTVKYLLPTRGVLGLRNSVLTATRGLAVLDSQFHDYLEWAGAMEGRDRGSLISFETGTVTPFGIVAAQDRGLLIVPPRTEVYENMLIGVHQRPGDLKVNVCKKKALTNMRASGSDDTIKITPAIELSLDSMVEYINDEELVEVTPSFVRMCKRPDWGKKVKKGAN